MNIFKENNVCPKIKGMKGRKNERAKGRKDEGAKGKKQQATGNKQYAGNP
jgi:hypothetical protein